MRKVNLKDVPEQERKSPASSPLGAPSTAKKDPTLFWITISALAACGATFFAGWAAWEAQSSAKEAAKATQASVWLQMLTEYATPEMLSSMKELRKWQQAHPEDFASRFKSLLLNPDNPSADAELSDKLERDRRRVAQFFSKLRVLSQLRVIDKRDVGLTWDSSTYTFVANVLMPIEQAKYQVLLETKSITANDYAQAEASRLETVKFYEDVFRRRPTH